MMSLPVLCFRLNNTGLARLGTSHVDLPLSPGRPASADTRVQATAATTRKWRNKSCTNQQSRRRGMHYQVVLSEASILLARRWRKPTDRFTHHETKWKKVSGWYRQYRNGGFTRESHPVSMSFFLVSFHNNDVKLSQFQVMICLLQSLSKV
jgi:hypothetical protein